MGIFIFCPNRKRVARIGIRCQLFRMFHPKTRSRLVYYIQPTQKTFSMNFLKTKKILRFRNIKYHLPDL